MVSVVSRSTVTLRQKPHLYVRRVIRHLLHHGHSEGYDITSGHHRITAYAPQAYGLRKYVGLRIPEILIFLNVQNMVRYSRECGQDILQMSILRVSEITNFVA